MWQNETVVEYSLKATYLIVTMLPRYELREIGIGMYTCTYNRINIGRRNILNSTGSSIYDHNMNLTTTDDVPTVLS